MKLIRLTDDRFVLDAGENARGDALHHLREYWKEWWEKNPGAEPGLFAVGGGWGPIEYEDRREPDIEARLGDIAEELGHLAREIKALKRPHSHYVRSTGTMSNDAEHRGPLP